MNMIYTQYIFGSRKQKNIFWFLIQVLPFVAASKSGNVSFVQEPVSEEIFSKYKYKYKYSVQERVSEEMFTSIINHRVKYQIRRVFFTFFCLPF